MGGTGRIRAAGLGVAVALLAGCGRHAEKQPAPAPAAGIVLPVVPRPTIDPDPALIPASGASAGPRPPQARRLTADECRRLAIKNAPFADALDAHPDNAAVSLHPWCKPSEAAKEAARTGAIARGHAADELRNRAAGDALEQFFQLAQYERQYDLLLAAQAELQPQIAAAEKAIAGGLHDRAGVNALRSQLHAVEAQAATVEAAIASLNTAVRARTGVAADDPLPLWPDDPLAIRPEVVDPEQAVRTGMLYRPDLNVLRSLLLSGPAAAEVRQSVLASVNPLLKRDGKSGLFASLCATMGKEKDRLDGAARQQIESALHGRERVAEAEIRAAVSSLSGHRAAAAARAAEVRQLTGVVAELEKKQAQGVSVTGELVKARLDLLKAKGEMMKSAADWNGAEAKLRQAMGLLVRE